MIAWSLRTVRNSAGAVACACALGGGIAPAAQGQSTWTELNQEFQVRNWQTYQGLPEDAISGLATTPDGYLWVGTFNGLVRFDGTSFTVLDSSNTPELPSSGIVNIHVDQSGRLWVSTYRGVSLLEKGRWTSLSQGNISPTQFIRTFSDRAGVVAMTTFDGHVKWSKGQESVALPDPPGIPGSGYFGHVTPEGTIWLGQAGFFGHWDGRSWVHSALEQTVTNGFCGIGSARDGTAIVARNGELLWCRQDTILRRVPVAELEGAVWTLYEDASAKVWVGTELHGLFVVSPTGTTKHYTEKNGLLIDTIRAVCQDAEGDVWLGTNGEGLVELRPRRFQRLHLVTLEPTRRVTTFFEEGPHRMLLGSFGSGVALAEGQSIRRLDFETDPARFRLVQSVLRDRSGTRWTAYQDEGLWTIGRDGQRAHIPSEQSGGNNVTALFNDSKGRIWIGGNESLAMYEAGQFHGFRVPGLALGGIAMFAEDPKAGTIWAGGAEGVFRFDGKSWTELRDANGGRLHDTVAVHCETDGTLWIGGRTVPLRRVKAGRFSILTATNGLPVNKVFGIVEDQLGFWWLPSNQGVARVAKADLDAVADGRQGRLTGQLFVVSDGLPSVDCVSGFQNTCLRDSTGLLWFSTQKGPATIDPSTLLLDRTPPKVFIDRFRVEDRVGHQFYKALVANTPVLVPPGQHEIAVLFSVPALRAAEKASTSYRIDGRDSSWRNLGGARSVYFYPPGPGDYRIRFRAVNADGFGPGTETSLRFVIQPFFWQTFGFRFLALTGLVGGVGGVTVQVGRRRMRLRVQDLERREVIEHDRLRLGSILEVTSDLVAFAGPQGSLEFLNAAGRRLLGIGAEQSVASLQITTPFDEPSANHLSSAGLPEATRTGTWMADLILRGADGRRIPVSLTLTVSRDPVGRVLWSCLIARDITERKIAEDSLRRSEAEFSQLFRLCPVPIAVSSLETGILLEMNSAMEVLVGCRREDVVGRSSAELGIWNCVQALRFHLASPKFDAGSTDSNEVRWINRRGIEVVAQYSVKQIELRGIPCGLTVLTDVTERKRIEEALQASETVLRQFVQYAPAAVAMFDCDLRYLQASERWRIDFQLTNADLTGQPSDAGFPSMPQRWKLAQKQALHGIVDRADEDRFVRPDGTEGWLQWEVRPWRHSGGEIGGVILFTQWITERKETLEQVQRQLTELQRWHRLTLEREQRILQLKTEVNALSQRLGEECPYRGAGLKPNPNDPRGPS